LLISLNLIIAIVVSRVTIAGLYRSSIASRLLDRAGHRSLHTGDKPRIGGIGIAAGLLSSVAATSFFTPVNNDLVVTLIAFSLLLVVSLIDDFKSLGVVLRLCCHLMIVFAWLHLVTPVAIYLQIQAGAAWLWLVMVVTLGICWSINLYNFMDGADGLAGGMTITGFSAYAVASWYANDLGLAAICLAVIGATIGFMKYNLPPSKLFLGDSGSISLGFLSAAIGAVGIAKGYWSTSFPLLLFAMFWVDSTYTLFKRIVQKKQFWKPHREHWYQKTILGGNSHAKLLKIHAFCNVMIALVTTCNQLASEGSNVIAKTLTIVVVLTVVATFGFWAECQAPKNISERTL
jgi:UDP-GlcNAc:undecaprenyl-phosphate/decaprenyl-phosphate GlcNAc-1-phosphate transferase